MLDYVLVFAGIALWLSSGWFFAKRRDITSIICFLLGAASFAIMLS
jgi:hypothetical protein